MTTARAILRRLLRHGRIDPHVPSVQPDPVQPHSLQADPAVGEQTAAEERIEAARQRLKQEIPPPDDESAGRPEQGAIPPPELSPGEGSPPVP